MNRDDLKIPEPCDADWDAMTGDDRKRFCLSCTKHVHNLSEMSKQDATHLIDTSKNLCVQYASHSSGEVFFNDSTHPAWRLHRQIEGAKRLLAAALLVPLAAACDVPKHSSSAISPVILINPDGSIKTPNPGAGLAPTMVVTPVEEDLIETTAGEPEIMRGEPEVFIQKTPPEVIKEPGNVVVEETPKPDEVEMFLGDITYEPEIMHDEPEIFIREAPPEVIEETPHRPDEIEMLQGDIAYEPDKQAEDTSDKQDTACDQDTKADAQPTHDTNGITGTPPKMDHTILRGKVAPSSIRKSKGSMMKLD
jgi:hypothetical protein